MRAAEAVHADPRVPRARRAALSPGVLIAVAAIGVYLACALPQLARPLMYDDANFALGIRAVAETGVPFGNQGWMSDRGDFSRREQWALWHPPLYLYFGATFVKLLGWTPAAMRLGGVLGGLATAALTFLLARDLTRGSPTAREVAGGSAVALTLLSPLVVQSTLVLDIDFTLLLPLTLAFLWLYLRLEPTPLRWLWLAPLFALLLWTKMTNPLPLVGVLGIWQLLRWRWRQAVVHPLAIGGGGAALFGVTWLAVGSALHFPLDMPFSVNAVQWQDSADVARRAYVSPGAFVEALQPTVLWLGPGLVSLGLASIALRGGQLVRCVRVRRADLLIGVFAVFVLGYVNKYAGWFPKYEVTFAPLLACLAAPLVAHAWCVRPRLTSAVAAVGTLVSAAITFQLIGDQWALQRTWSIDPAPSFWLLSACIVGLLVGLPWRAHTWTALAGLVALGLGWSLATDVRQLRAPYQTDYWYGTTGVPETTAWVDQHLEPGQTYVAAKEIAVRARAQRYVDQENLVYLLSIGRSFDGTWAGEPVGAIVAWRREAFVADLLERGLSERFRETARFGDYTIYEPSG